MFVGASGDSPISARQAIGLPMTPSVALRFLFRELSNFSERPDPTISAEHHFHGVIRPPVRGERRPIGDPVVDAIAEYSALILGRAGLLSTSFVTGSLDQFEQHGRLTRQIFAIEHHLGVEISKHDDLDRRQRERGARATIAIAAYWCHQDELVAGGHPLLGLRPTDRISRVLYDHAFNAWASLSAIPSTNEAKDGKIVSIVLERNLGNAV